MKNIKLLFALVGATMLTGCEELISDVDIDERYLKPKIVVHSYLSSEQDTLSVVVKKSVPVFSKEYKDPDEINEPIKQAVVKILDKNTQQELIIPYNDDKSMYVMKVTPSFLNQKHSYLLNVSAPEMTAVHAECVIPKKLETSLKNISVYKANDINSSNTTIFNSSFEFDDNAEEQNYYMAEFILGIVRVGDPRNYEDIRKVRYFFSDKRNNGKTFFVKKALEFRAYDRDKLKCSRIKIKLYSVDKNYYEYIRTVDSQKENTEGGPFGEPTIIVSNINNGLGVFGGYTFIEKEKLFD